MLEHAQPRIREILAQCRAAAYLGKPQAAINRAESSLCEIDNAMPVDKIATAMFKAEILYLDGNGEDALTCFDSEVAPLLSAVPHQFQIVAGYNRTEISFGTLKPDDSYYPLLDEAKVGGVILGNPQAICSAMEDAAAGKLHESFPTFWQELLRRYRQGSWSGFRSVCKHMAGQFLRLKRVDAAVYYAILACEKETAQKIGTALLQQGTEDLLTIAVVKLVTCAQLKRHFLIGCDLLESMMDAVPDEQVGNVFSWLLARATVPPGNYTENNVVKSAWRVLAKLDSRIDPERAIQLVNAATDHPCWLAKPEQNRVDLVQPEIIAAILNCVDKLPSTVIASLATKTVPLVTTHKQDFHYDKAIDLLCHIAHYGTQEVRESLRAVLYPQGQKLNALLVQVAKAFGHTMKEDTSWGENAKRVAENIRLQVQCVPKGSEPKPVSGACMTYTATVGDQNIVCSISNTVDLHAIIRHSEFVPSENLTQLVDAILDMIESADNILENKIVLIDSLRHMSWQFGKDQQARLWRALASLAKGDVKEPPHVMSWAEANNPMNPFKMRSGNPSDVRGMSLFVLACLEREHVGMFGAKLNAIIELGLSDFDGNVRRYAFAAARDKPTVSESVIIAILLGTRDADATAAAAAFDALANKSNLKLSRPQWRLLVQSMRLAKQNPLPRLRSAAASAATKLMPAAPTKAIHQEISQLVTEFSKDTCYSVRSKALTS